MPVTGSMIHVAIIPAMSFIPWLIWLAIEWRRALAQFELAGRGIPMEPRHDL